MAVASRDVHQVDWLINIGLHQKKGVCVLLASVMAAAQGHYHPKSFTEEEDMHLIYCPPIIPSHAKPTADQVLKNVEATLEGVLDVIHSQMKGKAVHTLVMFDELATEKRIHWDPKSNFLLGICRQHASENKLQFLNEQVLEELFANLNMGKVHYAVEATIGALGILCKDNHIYPGGLFLSRVTHFNGINSLQQQTKLHIVSIASDGEIQHRSTFIELTFKQILSSQSPIYPILQAIKFLNLHDWKHIFKRFQNLLLQLDHLKSFGLTADHIWSLFNPDDQQDVKIAFDLLKDIWTLPSREVLWTLGKLLFHMIFPYLCIDLSLSEQIEHLSAAAHLALVLYKLARKDFIQTNLYIDLMIMIKNILFCIAKAKIDNPSGQLWIILLGIDQLEELFGILRKMVINDANSDILQLVYHLSGTTEVSNILTKYPHWDRTPRCLKLPALSCGSKEIPDSADHIKPSSWRGNVKVRLVSLQMSWNHG
ncbi:hypothetical protein CPB84DRAFT_1899648 [Gymnopilus junonius]|uniref:Uncharacterized protein n=1 Tax=Gymnopilus junonius TaxID=109634 RepID=A0A9P5TFP4_GYMJU|nr:hypothetical protein CPB84DRAFT_1899648 [Gymnopilus junonius]